MRARLEREDDRMPTDIEAYAQSYPTVPPGGLFLAVVGLAICLGAPFARWRQVFLFVGLAAASVAMVLFVGRLTTHLPPPTLFAIGALLVAVALEIALFPLVIRRRGQRAQARSRAARSRWSGVTSS